MTENTDASALTETKRTDETTRSQHLSRLEDLRVRLEALAKACRQWGRQWNSKRERYEDAPPLTLLHPHAGNAASMTDDLAASLRWLIERERARS